MASLFGREKRIIYLRKIKGFWEEYRRNKIGLVGLTILLIYAVVAVFSPYLTPYDPSLDVNLAQGLAMPEWVTILPQYSDTPRTMNLPVYWNASEKSDLIDVEWGRKLAVSYLGGTTETAQANVTHSFLYSYSPPRVFHVTFTWMAEKVEETSYTVVLNMVTTNGTKYRIWHVASDREQSGDILIDSMSYKLLTELGYEPAGEILAERIFAEKGAYSLLLTITFRPKSTKATCKISLTNTEVNILGRVHGILGTDQAGRDIFSQLIVGTRISIIVGLLAAVISTFMGVTVGVVSGYLGGVADEILMRMVDVLLCLPMLPLVLTLIFIFGKSPFHLIFIIAVFWWLGLSRVIRSRVLSLREMPFIESAKASGAGKLYTISKHLVPNVLPVALASMILSVPGAIILEASLSFLGFGDPATSTWGRMLNHAFHYGAFWRLAWWWLLPPGLAIVFLCLSFVFVGHAVDEIVNPRLRKRR